MILVLPTSGSYWRFGRGTTYPEGDFVCMFTKAITPATFSLAHFQNMVRQGSAIRIIPEDPTLEMDEGL